MSRRKQARPIRHLDQESSEEEGGSKVNVGKKKSVSERKVDSGGEDGAGENRERRRTLRGSGEEGQEGDELRGEVVVGDEGKGGKPVNGLLPRSNARTRSNSTTHHHSRVFHHHNTKFSYSSDEEDANERGRASEDGRRMQMSSGGGGEKKKIKKMRLDEDGVRGRGEGAKENFVVGGAGSRRNRAVELRGSKDEDPVMELDTPVEDANNNEETQNPTNLHVSHVSTDKVNSEEKFTQPDGLPTSDHTALKDSMTAAIQNLIGTWPTTLPTPGNNDTIPSVTLEALQNTKVAMAQFAANALNAVNAGKSDPISNLTLLQQTLMTLQHQKLIHLQILNQYETETETHDDDEEECHRRNKRKKIPSTPPKPETPPQSTRSKPPTQPLHKHDKELVENGEKKVTSHSSSLSPHFASLLNCGNQDPNRPLSPGLPPPHMMMGMHESNNGGGQKGMGGGGGVSHESDDPMMMMSNMLLPPPPVNTLEVLQKRAQEVLDSASQGLLASSLAADDPRKKGIGYDKSREPFFKHRCRYCGKVFGSDSALQIHIRSHTGERPFKCNVCGSRFTTKGNLKVHFQRHAAKFPHIKMNPHPVPEHLDHFHPPLLAAGQTSPPDLSPNSMIPPPLNNSFAFPQQQHHHHPFHSITGGPPPPPPPPPRDNRVESSMSALLRFDMISKYEEQYGKPLMINTPQDLTKKDEPELARVKSEPVATRFAGSNAVDPLDPMESDDAGAESFDDENDDEAAGQASQPHQQELVRCMMMMMRDKPNKVTNVSGIVTGDDDEDECDGDKDGSEERNRRTKSRPRKIQDEDLCPKNLSNNDINDDERKSLFDGEDGSGLVSGGEQEQSRGGEMQREAFKRSTRGGSIGKQPPHPSHAHAPDRPHSATSFPTRSHQDLRLLLPSSATSSPTTSSPSYPSSQEPSPSKHSPTQPPPSELITKDPAIYTNLLPRPGSNDNAWETLIEVTKTSETSKLQQLVDNIEHKLTDPNQCIICHRVLSCKSALQMHYRTHTGERPFKCKICGRAFTTKGNLKTHMGVHRAKPPLRVLHQCPVCHKRFTNSLVLQQHIRLHTGEPTDLTPDQIRAAEVKDHYLLTPSSTSSTPSPNSYPYPQPPSSSTPPTSTPLPPHLYTSPPYPHSQKDEDSDMELSDTDTINSTPAPPLPQSLPFSTSLAALENQVKTIMTQANNQNMMMMMMADKNRMPEDLTKRMFNDSSDDEDTWKAKDEVNHDSPEPQDPESKRPLDLTGPSKSTPQSPPPRRPVESPTPPPQLPHGFPPGLPPGMLLPPGAAPPNPFGLPFNSPLLIPPPPPPPGSAAAAALSVAMAERARLGDNAPFFWTTAGPGALARGNTTCSICLKTFACNSALEIHYRSHTKERPFKCTVCDRGFSTKGNMKQHMLTHKIRDMPSSGSSSSSGGSNTQGRSNLDTTPPPANNSVESGVLKSSDDEDEDNSRTSPFNGGFVMDGGRKAETDEEQHKEQEVGVCMSSEDEHSQPPPPPRPDHPSPSSSTHHTHHRSPSPPPHQSTSQSSFCNDPSLKHICKVCTKNFSSTSALQIHMRTHTGDRPFVCSVCQKAFTTKGNLKVHMGTHMWTNGASRRGRRMSLDMPLGLAAAVAAAAASGTGPPPPHHPFFHHPHFQPPPPPPPPTSILGTIKKDPDSPSSNTRSNVLLYHHVQNHPYGPSHNQSPLLFLNGSLQKDLVQGFSRGSSISPILHQASSSKSSNNTSDSKDDSLADRNNASSPGGVEDEEMDPEMVDKQVSPKGTYFERESDKQTHKKLEMMMIKRDGKKAEEDNNFDEDGDGRGEDDEQEDDEDRVVSNVT